MNDRKRVVILGAGVTGLAAAHRLSRSKTVEVHVIDRESEPGGVCRSFTEGDFILDYGPHKFYTLLDGVLDELKSLMGDELLEREKVQKLYLAGQYYTFPLKLSEAVMHFPLSKTIKILSTFGVQLLKNQISKREVATYEEFIVQKFGSGLYQEIFAPMARKMFGDPRTLDRKLAEVRVSAPGLWEVLKQALLNRSADRTVSAATFHYPRHGFGSIPARLHEKAKSQGTQFHLGARILRLETKDRKVCAVHLERKSGETLRLPVDELIYTIPLSALDSILGGEVPEAVRRASREVSYRNVIIYYYLLKSRPILPAMWVFCPEARFRFGRLSEMIKFSPYTAPPGHTSLMVDFTCEENDFLWHADDATVGAKLSAELAPMKLFAPGAVLKQFSRRFRQFYPKYSLGYQQNLIAVRQLEALYSNLRFIGRVGDFNYNNSDQCLDMGFRAADHILSGHEDLPAWQVVRQRFEEYRIVD